MDSQVQSLAEWMTSTPAGVCLTAIVLLVPIAAAWQLRKYMKGIEAAARMVANQFDSASQAEVDALVHFASEHKQKAMVLEQLATVRRLYGHQSVRKGHIYWLAGIINGDDELVSPPPTFNRPAAPR